MSAPGDLFEVLAPGTHVLEASAGTGKTWTITTLVASALALGIVTPAKVLAVTFTRAATAELRVRVRERVAELADAVLRTDSTNEDHEVVQALIEASEDRESAPLDESAIRGQLHARLRDALADADAIGVDTMHGWCASLLGQYGDLLGVDAPSDEASTSLPPVAELTERGALVASAQSSLPHWLGFTQRLASEQGLEQVASAVLAGVARVNIVGANGEPLAEDEASRQRLIASFDAALALHARLAKQWAAEGEAYESTLHGAVRKKALNGTYWRANWTVGRLHATDELLGDVNALFAAKTDLISKVRYLTNDSLRSCSKDASNVISLGAFGDTLGELLALLPDVQAALTAPLRAFVDTVQGALPRRAEDFDALLRLVADGLVREPAVAERVRRSADLVLIDESQDTDPLQWRIFSSLFHDTGSPKRLVLVGDPKQSIYRFRNAEVAVYLAARAVASQPPHTLDTNFRSDPALVEAVNTLYAASPGIFGADVVFDRVSARRSVAELSPPADRPFTFVHVPPEISSRNVHALRAEIAADVARRIAHELRTPESARRTIAVKGEAPRPVSPRDCAVLVSTNRHGWLVVQALRAAGVHAVAASRQAVTQGGTARDLYALLSAMELVGDRAALRRAALTALVRPALELDLRDPPSVILQVLDGDAGRQFDEALRAARARWVSRGVLDAWISLDRALSLSRHVAAGDEAERRLTDVRHLLELLAAHESHARATPVEALRWLAERIAERDVDQIAAEELEERLESDEDAVRVITMHASKGLEFPLVWIPFAWTTPRAFCTTREKPLVRRYDVQRAEIEGIVPVNGPKPSEHPVAKAEQAALALEHQRLLYVALTRARNACTVYVSDAPAHVDSSLSQLLGAVREDKKAGVAPVLASAQAQALAAGPGSGIAAECMQFGDATAMARRVVSSEGALQAVTWRRTAPLDLWWRRGSFTALTYGAYGRTPPAPERSLRELSLVEAEDDVHSPAADEGENLQLRRSPAGAERGHPASRIPLADLPRGRAAGNALHDIFERVVARGGAPGLVRAHADDALARQGLDAERWGAPLGDALEAVLDVPLVGLGRSASAPWPSLRMLAEQTSFPELTFDFAVAARDGYGVRARQLARAFAEHPGGAVPAGYADRIAVLDFSPLRGLLNGAIDLVVRHNDTWALVDYKSNYLGDALDDYSPNALTHAMQTHHYILQYHLYLVALHRFLRLRQSQYDYDVHVTGVAYLFVRGMNTAQPGAGVFTDCPPRARIEALDAALRDGERL